MYKINFKPDSTVFVTKKGIQHRPIKSAALMSSPSRPVDLNGYTIELSLEFSRKWSIFGETLCAITLKLCTITFTITSTLNKMELLY